MKLYVNCITSGAGLRRDIKELIPEMNLRRRMSRLPANRLNGLWLR